MNGLSATIQKIASNLQLQYMSIEISQYNERQRLKLIYQTTQYGELTFYDNEIMLNEADTQLIKEKGTFLNINFPISKLAYDTYIKLIKIGFDKICYREVSDIPTMPYHLDDLLFEHFNCSSIVFDLQNLCYKKYFDILPNLLMRLNKGSIKSFFRFHKITYSKLDEWRLYLVSLGFTELTNNQNICNAPGIIYEFSLEFGKDFIEISWLSLYDGCCCTILNYNYDVLNFFTKQNLNIPNVDDD